jgi:hypothetical protein
MFAQFVLKIKYINQNSQGVSYDMATDHEKCMLEMFVSSQLTIDSSYDRFSSLLSAVVRPKSVGSPTMAGDRGGGVGEGRTPPDVANPRRAAALHVQALLYTDLQRPAISSADDCISFYSVFRLKPATSELKVDLMTF